ncbi:uncharacterized protein LOC108912094 [Anoplophora glabripennis]|uniref:uncharacterized protein LOC108912094 n=1 Tax=Anoplophora glabripennis TaxID=217634 RepID=UPI000874F8AD|nr:uncharacterized protein LOC108912094 [Anoplophora glabripennis]
MESKLCVVPSCNNNEINHPEKLFLTVPKNAERRENWALAMDVRHIPLGAKYCVCEDHFNLSIDSTNWLYYTMMGAARLMLKPDVVPHKFITCPPKDDLRSQLREARKRNYTFTYSWVSVSKKNKLDIQEVTKEENEHSEMDEPHLSGTIGVKLGQSVKDVAIQTNIRKSHRSRGTNTEPIETCVKVMSSIGVKENKTKRKQVFSSKTYSQNTCI